MDKRFAIKSWCTINGNKGPILCLKCRDEEHEAYLFKIDSTTNPEILPRFGILASESHKVSRHDPRIVKLGKGSPGLRGEEITYVYTHWPYQVKQLRNKSGFSRTFEADVRWHNVAMLELGLKGYFTVENFDPFDDWLRADQIVPCDKFYSKTRCVTFDIESDHHLSLDRTGTFGSHDNIEDISVIEVTAVDNFEKIYYTFVHTPGESGVEEIFCDSRLQNRPKMVPGNAHRIIYKCETEEEVLSGFFKYVSKRMPDCLQGHNICGNTWLISNGKSQKRKWRNGYDIPILVYRAKHLGVEYSTLSPAGIVQFFHKDQDKTADDSSGVEIYISLVTNIDFIKADDFFEVTKRLQEYEEPKGVWHDMVNSKLNTYMDYFFHVGKVAHEGTPVWELYKEDWKTGSYYCWGDVEGSFALGEKFEIADKIFAITSTYGIHPSDVMYVSRQQDFLTLSYTRGKYTLPSKYEARQEVFVTDEKKGAYVVPTIPGRHVNIAYIDFHKLYPNINRACNVGVDTKVMSDTPLEGDYVRTPFPGLYYRKDIISLNNRIYTDLIDSRKSIDKKLEDLAESGVDINSAEYLVTYGEMMSIKITTNGKHGNDGNPGDRLYDPDNYNVVTAIGRDGVMNLEVHLRDVIGRNVVIGDTDGLGVELHGETVEELMADAEMLCDIINKFFRKYLVENYNVLDPSYLSVGVEDISSVIVAAKKKHYIKKIIVKDGKILDRPQVFWKGFKKVKKDGSVIEKRGQKMVGEIAVHNPGKEEFRKAVVDIDKMVKHGNWTELRPSAPLNKAVSLYSDSYAPIMGVKNSEALLKKEFKIGERFYWGKFQDGKTTRKMWLAFMEQDIEKIKNLGYSLDAGHAEELIVNRANEILNVMNYDYYSLLRNVKNEKEALNEMVSGW